MAFHSTPTPSLRQVRGAKEHQILFKQTWRKVMAIKNHPPGLDVFDAAAGLISLAIVLWILAQMVTL